jgi:hypothetical protein
MCSRGSQAGGGFSPSKNDPIGLAACSKNIRVTSIARPHGDAQLYTTRGRRKAYGRASWGFRRALLCLIVEYLYYYRDSEMEPVRQTRLRSTSLTSR